MKKNKEVLVTQVTFDIEHEGIGNPTEVLRKWLFPADRELPNGVITIKVNTSTLRPYRPKFPDRREEIYMSEVKPFESTKITTEEKSTVSEIVTKCKKHPFYTGQRKQRTECTDCEKVYSTFQASKKSQGTDSTSTPKTS